MSATAASAHVRTWINETRPLSAIVMRTAKQELDPVLNSLLQENGVKTLRKSLDQLGGLVSDSSFRQRLAAESGGQGSSIVLKRRALSLVWKNVLSIAIRAIKVLFKTRKPQRMEFALFAKLLTSLSQADAVEKDIRPMLSLEILGKVRMFAISLFTEHEVVKTCEEELFKILIAICSRRDFVGIFRPDDFDDIMDILEPRLDVEQSIECGFTFDIVEAASRTLETLITTTISIGISMHDHVAECIMWIARRCKSHVRAESGGIRTDTEDNTLQQTVFTLLRTATMLMRSEPDHAIGPLKTYGHAMLGIARRMYRKVSGVDKDAIIEFITGYM